MSLSSPTDADYVTCAAAIRDVLASGGNMSTYNLRLTLACLKAHGSACTSVTTAASALTAAVTAQMAILQAKGTSDASAEIDTADTTLSALATALTAASPTTPSIPTNTTADGNAS